MITTEQKRILKDYTGSVITSCIDRCCEMGQCNSILFRSGEGDFILHLEVDKGDERYLQARVEECNETGPDYVVVTARFRSGSTAKIRVRRQSK